MKARTGYLVAFAIAFAPIGARAQNNGLAYPQLNVPDRGGRLGVTTEGPYAWNGIQVLKVIEVQPASGLYGTVYPGDYIYGINGFNLRGNDDLRAIISYGSPGAVATVYYLDARRNLTAMKVTVRTIPASVYAQSGASNQAASSSAGSKSFCEEHYIICGVGALVGAAVIASAVSGSGSSAGSGTNGGTADDGYTYRQRQSDSSSSSTPAEKPRSYGLYGDCPQPGAGYGC
jgi:hypothetical protein